MDAASGMNNMVQKGARGQTLGPLRPSGKIVLSGTTYEARSEGLWVDHETEIIVIDSRSGSLIVRPIDPDDAACHENSESLMVGEPTITTPLHAPPCLVERVNGVVWGVTLGALIIPTVLLAGYALNYTMILLPLAGAAAGGIFRTFVRQAINSVGPREDHRVRAYLIASLLLVGASLGIWAGGLTAFGCLGISVGLVLGTLAGGVAGWTSILILMML